MTSRKAVTKSVVKCIGTYVKFLKSLKIITVEAIVGLPN